MRARETRARARGERRSRSEEKKSRPFSSLRPNLSSFFAINVHNFTFSLAARGSEEGRKDDRLRSTRRFELSGVDYISK